MKARRSRIQLFLLLLINIYFAMVYQVSFRVSLSLSLWLNNFSEILKPSFRQSVNQVVHAPQDIFYLKSRWPHAPNRELTINPFCAAEIGHFYK